MTAVLAPAHQAPLPHGTAPLGAMRAPALTHRDAELDGLRGLAVAMVLAWHFIGIPAWLSTGSPAMTALFRTFLLGGAGVDLFFVLSGFLITRIILQREQPAGGFLRAFYVRRALRILPPYLLLVAVFWATVASGLRDDTFGDQIPLWRLLTFTQNFWMGEHGRYGPGGIAITWSVAIEEQYYLVFPLIALCVGRRRLPYVLAAVAVASIAWRAVVFQHDPWNNFPSDLGTLARLDGLAVGGLIACALQAPRWRDWLQAHDMHLRVALAVSLALLLQVRRDSGTNMAYIGHTLLTACFGLLVVQVMLHLGSRSAWVAWLRNRALAYLGRISYGVYLFHPLAIALVLRWLDLKPTLDSWRQAGALALAFAATIVWCDLLFRHSESRLIRLGRRLPY